MASKGNLVSALQTRRKEILGNWLQQLEQASASTKGRLSTKDLGKQADEFLNVLAATRAGTRRG